MTVFNLTTDSNNIILPLNHVLIDYNRSLPLYINSNGSFTFHYAVWPYICLFTIVAVVWLSLYLSTIYARRHLAKHGRYRLSSICQTQDSTMGGEYETSRVLSTINV
ncbi:unnamed protein product [Adineta steineri]|uniref:Uncharacterized protein n=1 Tax=Adineta steineri TaxID=433720 RepID=A0A815ESS5_9BILA|nr:unnamed protein product [Adineta steineri]